MIRKIGKIVGIVVLALILLASIYIGIIRVTGTVPNFFGFGLFRVQNDDMKPTLETGDIVLMKAIDPKDVKKDDVIIYRGTEGTVAYSTVVHQIVEVTENPDGTFTFIARGTKNGSIDDPAFSGSQIVGKAVFEIPVLGTIYDFFSHWYGILFIIALIAVTFGSDVARLIRKIIESKKEAPSPDEVKHAIKPELNSEINYEISRQADELLTDLDDPS